MPFGFKISDEMRRYMRYQESQGIDWSDAPVPEDRSPNYDHRTNPRTVNHQAVAKRRKANKQASKARRRK